MSTPTTLQAAIIFFADPENCREFMTELRWPDGKVTCPNCGSDNVKYLPNARVFKCFEKHPRQKFSLKVGTIFEDSPIGLEKWLPAMWLVVNCKNGISSWEVHRALGVTQKTAWFMLQRIRLAMQESGGKLSGEIEVDETFIGGKRATCTPRSVSSASPARAAKTRRSRSAWSSAAAGFAHPPRSPARRKTCRA
jgi:transposase-like protein